MATHTYKRTHPTSTHVDCTDLADRRRTVTTHTSNGAIVLIAPPGEAAKLTPDQARELAHQLLDRAISLDDGRFDPARGWRKSPPGDGHVIPMRRS